MVANIRCAEIAADQLGAFRNDQVSGRLPCKDWVVLTALHLYILSNSTEMFVDSS